ncbi:MAG: hypothetical protein JJT94_15450 [Bernardetiaceae bacterium]|nr:hypothetical protein [Bernardetiaceae bacterium]
MWRIFLFLILALLLSACSKSDKKTVRGVLRTERALRTPIGNAEAVIVCISRTNYIASKGLRNDSKACYCQIADDATITVDGKVYKLIMTKKYALRKPRPWGSKAVSNDAFRISKTEPDTLPAGLRTFHLELENHIRALRRDKHIKSAVPGLSGLHLEEWHYEPEQEVKIRVKIKGDVAYLEAAGL